MSVSVGAPVKFGRTYQMSILGKSNIPITVGFPLTLEFDVTHNIFAAANTGNFSLYNLSATNRSEISFSTYLKSQSYPVVLRAGYVSQQSVGLAGAPSSLPVIFNGFANVAYTEKVGVELVTRINAFDNGDITNNSRPSATFGLEGNAYTAPIGTDFVSMVKAVMARLAPSGIKAGQVAINTSVKPKPITGIPRAFSGSVWQALQDLASECGAGTYVYIENGVCNMLGPLDVLPVTNSLGVLQSSTGLLGVPKYTDSTILCSMIFEPSLTIGAQIELNSIYTPQANGLCKIVAYTHQGTISGVESGSLTSGVTLMRLDAPLGAG